MPQLGVPELVLILVIVIAVFGAGKLANIGGALGKGVKDFRSSIRDESKPEAEEIVAAPKAVVNSQPVAPQVMANPETNTPEGGEGGQSA
ncbi:MAG: twin-arginine translocase TatA/TatE family subunit [Anaerolineae bacterium]